MARALAALLPIRVGEEEVLRQTLLAIGDDIAGRRLPDSGRPHIFFTNCRSVHFARLALWPITGDGQRRLLYAVIHDGDVVAHAAELHRATVHPQALWGRLEGYSGEASFADLLCCNRYEPRAFYAAFRQLTVAEIECAVASTAHLEALLDEPAVSHLLQLGLPHAPAGAGVVPGHRRRALAPWLLVPVELLVLAARHGPRRLLRVGRQMIASLEDYRFLARLLRARQAPLDSCWSEYPPAAARYLSDIPSFREDEVAQNQLTLVTPIDPARRQDLEIALALIDLYARRLAPPGELLGVRTIHFVRWLFVDDHLLLISDYDGGWRAYIEDFVVYFASVLDAIWSCCDGYPRQGSRDTAATLRYFRRHQLAPLVAYAAYPDTSISRVAEALRLQHALASRQLDLRRLQELADA